MLSSWLVRKIVDCKLTPCRAALANTEACAFCQLQLAQYILSGGVGQYSFEEVAVIRRPFAVINLIYFRICCKSCHFLDNEKQSSSNKIHTILFLTLQYFILKKSEQNLPFLNPKLDSNVEIRKEAIYIINIPWVFEQAFSDNAIVKNKMNHLTKKVDNFYQHRMNT
ncbi:hypothetical protein T11_249 [Trichinella zimbabwensis]|uniref:Uncharacterized protein n=1 Tax=Trichinella zimbabwensis TaxID=268475 RepID=A0A0V1HMQ5_9BILA|nr:hypothetical protein T11_249 [Trichinella zimbabwensis]